MRTDNHGNAALSSADVVICDKTSRERGPTKISEP